jgi:SAM-dependent methyltransferase
MKEIDILKYYPKSNRSLFYNKRRKLSGKGYLKIDRENFNDEDLLIEYTMLSKAREFQYEYFDGDRLYGYGGYYYNKKYWQKTAKHIIDYYQLKNGMKVLDVGCAKGFLLYEINKINPLIEVYGLDISSYAINNSKDEINQRLSLGNAIDLPYKNDFFDLVLSINTIDHLDIDEAVKAISEIERVKKNNSFISLNSWNTNKQKDNLMSWNLVSKTIMSKTDWKIFLKTNNYTGDYYWFLAN